METYNRTLMPRSSQMQVQREAEWRALLCATGEQALATVDEAKAAHAVLEIGEVQAARRRLSDASFGHCLDCGASRPGPLRLCARQATHAHERTRDMRRGT